MISKCLLLMTLLGLLLAGCDDHTRCYSRYDKIMKISIKFNNCIADLRAESMNGYVIRSVDLADCQDKFAGSLLND